MTKTRVQLFDWLRIYALLIIICYHFYPSFLPGGFLGVDVFFCLSGYLLAKTALPTENGASFSLPSFYRKRFYRIYPSLALAVALSLLLALLGNPDTLVDIGRQTAACLGSVTNLYELRNGLSYEAQFVKPLFLHTWYLSIAVHEYLLFGLLLVLCFRFNVGRASISRFLMRRMAGIIGLLSFAYAFLSILFGASIDRIYFSDLSRFYPFFAGVFACCLPAPIKDRIRARLASARLVYPLFAGTFFAGLTAMSFAFSYSDKATYLLCLPLTTLFTSFLLVLTDQKQATLAPEGRHARDSRVSEAGLYAWARDVQTTRQPARETQTNRHPLRKGSAGYVLLTTLSAASHRLSSLTYGIYLFHWPAYVALTQKLPYHVGVITALFLALLFALFSFHLWEPLLLGRSFRFGDRSFDFVFRRAFVVIPLLFFLTLSSLAVIRRAPARTKLETTLWEAELQQSFDSMQSLHDRLANKFRASDLDGCLLIGDSVTVGIRDRLLDQIPDSQVDAALNRTMSQGVNLLKDYISQGNLKDITILALGTNAMTHNDYTYIDQAIEALPEGHRLILVTPYNANASQDAPVYSLIEHEREIRDKYPFVTVADWNQKVTDQPSLYEKSDGVHFIDNPDTCQAYVDFMKENIDLASRKPPKGTQSMQISLDDEK